MKKFVLMHKNKSVAKVNINDKGIVVDYIIEPDFMPFGVIETNEDTIDKRINQWNGDRCIPLGRPNYKDMMDKYGIKQSSNWVVKSYMCSLTDCYWFKPEDSNVTWEDVNFYKIGFSTNLYKHLFYNENEEIITDFNSPDITTNGAEPKMWTEKGDGFYLLKHYSGTKPITVCNEYIVSKIFAKIGLDCVDYDLIKKDNKVCCESKCFIISDKEEFVPTTDLMKEYGYTMKNVEQLMSKLGFEKEFNEMVIGDYLSGNADRHSGNFGLIIDADSRRFKKFAPLFDHGATYMYEDIDRADYFVGETKFGNAIQNVDAKYLNIVNNISESDLLEILNSVPYMRPSTKNEVFCEFFRRVEHVNSLIREKEVKYDREP